MPTTNHTEMTDSVATRKVAPSRAAAVQPWRAASRSCSLTQGFLYAPFGEITTEYAPLWQNGVLPNYTFNAKELDEESGMHYYEARYYAPPVFVSRDAMFEKQMGFSDAQILQVTGLSAGELENYLNLTL